ncbi:MAG: hypothetical protein ACO27U_01570, partial [Ilumatobacteraceae bacterium]
MDVQSMELFSSLLAIVAAGGVIVVLTVRVLGSRFGAVRPVAEGLHGAALWLAWLVAAVATQLGLPPGEVVC